MKRIIDGKMYDTDTATRVYEEVVFGKRRTLYITKHGAWFLFYHSKKEIVPKTEDEVKEYLGEKDVDKYIEYFGEVPEA